MSRTTRIARVLAAQSSEGLLKKARDRIDEHADPSEIYAIYWNPGESKIYVSNGDWAEYDTNALFRDLETLLGKGNVAMEAEGSPGDSDGNWLRFDPDSRTPRKPRK